MPKKKLGEELFENPEEIDERNLGEVSFASHMSYLTNKRLHNLFEMCDVAGINAGSTYQLDAISIYRASLWGVYTVIESVLKGTVVKNKKKIIGQREIITKMFEQFDDLRFKPRDQMSVKMRYTMYVILSDIHRTMLSNLQENGQFFFRMDTHPIKGLRRVNIIMGYDKLDESKVNKK